MQSFDGNWEHLVLRYKERMEGYEDRFKACLRGILKRVKARTMPNVEWYRPVTDNSNNTVAYLCGQGVHVRTVLTRDMVPYGQKV